ncbi:hypothetical protein FTX61_19490 [Nitriliruptoraceae bacterium ZYF776]|nr:hypothetical protein [Profundirhabdus halotolerans]
MAKRRRPRGRSGEVAGELTETPVQDPGRSTVRVRGIVRRACRSIWRPSSVRRWARLISASH